ncbi:hypothetical protein BMS3Bbin02_00016 [bacterium BMS3Bbin02]|nr:hypothetical protein BMS3Bbin02_00016 [bacterium BMS3Bbin02]
MLQTFALLAVSLLPMQHDPSPQVIATQAITFAGEPAALLFYDDGSATINDQTGTVLASITSIGDKDKQEFYTEWKDAKNVTHHVTTPFGGRTTGGRSAAVDRHKDAVALMQAAFPPV